MPEQQETGKDEGEERSGSRVAAEREPAVFDRLVEKVPDDGAPAAV